MPRHVPLEEQFAALAEENDWDEEEWDFQRISFLAQESLRIFTAQYGYDENSLVGWQKICNTVGIKKAKQIPSIADCKKVSELTKRSCGDMHVNDISCTQALQHVHVNIIDLVDAAASGHQMARQKKFATEEICAAYTRITRKIMPKSYAKRNKLLSQFLVEVFNFSSRRRRATAR
jgi:hypothetical protein